MDTRFRGATRRVLFAVAVLAIAASPVWAQKRAMTIEDVMKFRTLTGPVFSDNGQWVAYESAPDRGDGHGEVKSTDGRSTYTVERGTRAQITTDGAWAGFTVEPPQAVMEDPSKKDDRPRNAMALVATRNGETTRFDDVNRFSFSDDGKWLARLHFEPKTKKKWEGGTELVLRKLADGTETTLPFVKAFQFDSTSTWLVYTYADSTKLNGVFAVDLTGSLEPLRIDTMTEGHFSLPTWHNASGRMAWLAAATGPDKKPAPAAVKVWGKSAKAVNILIPASPDAPAKVTGTVGGEWMVPFDTNLRWTDDGERIFLGLRPFVKAEAPDTTKQPFELFDIDRLVDQRGLDVWHWNDPVIATQQKARFRQEQNRSWQAVFHVRNATLVPLADETMDNVQFTNNPARALGMDNRSYAKMTTWDGSYNDVYSVNLNNGERKKLLTQHSGQVYLSPQGTNGVFYKDGNWHVIYMATGTVRDVTSSSGGVFVDNEDDHPGDKPSHGFAGWVAGDEAFRVYDARDIWEFAASGMSSKNLTKGQGEQKNATFRIQNVDRGGRDAMAADEALVLSGYDNNQKSNGYYRLDPTSGTVTPLITENKRITFVTKIPLTGQMVYTRQTTNEYPDLWISDANFKGGKKITDFGKQLDSFLIGTSELVKWTDLNGNPLEGVLIKPGNYEPGKRYPVIVYYYELSNQRLHEFNQTVVNHRPSFNFYASNGYALFLPDVRYDVGLPGYSATRSLVPGVQKIIDMGVADPNAIGLHGHSWSGYQTLFVITQTDIFACAVAGAPVSNMTSAYSGIRWGAGVARQFQYERGQSRIGESMFEAPEKYIENSPVFFAERIKTPLLMEHGDADEAVPWYQSIEMYLAMRRLGKDAIFLQYRDEPHHLQKYPNKVDYTIKMKEYFDHYLKGMPAADWITNGAPYNGK